MKRKIRLLPTNKRMKELIREHGNEWFQLEEPRPMPCFNGELGIPVRDRFYTHVRNIKMTDFEDINEDS